MRKLSIVGFVILLIAGFSSCTIEKRHYRDGFYVDWNNHSAKTQETVALNEPTSASELPIRIVEVVDTSSSAFEVKQKEEISLVTNHHGPFVTSEKKETETPQDVTVNAEKSSSPLPIEKDKKQATGAGVAAAAFFILGMAGLVIKGTAPPTGIFIGAAFLCCIICIVLASVLYPQETRVKQPKNESPDKGSPGSAAPVAAGIVIAAAIIVCGFITLTLGLFFLDLFLQIF